MLGGLICHRKGTRSSRARSPSAASALTMVGSRLGGPVTVDHRRPEESHR